MPSGTSSPILVAYAEDVELKNLMKDFSLVDEGSNTIEADYQRKAFPIWRDYLLEFWRHSAELSGGERKVWDRITGPSGGWWWYDGDDAREPVQKTRWQQVAETLFAQWLSLERFDSNNDHHLAGLAKLYEKSKTLRDPAPAEIIRNYFSTIGTS